MALPIWGMCTVGEVTGVFIRKHIGNRLPDRQSPDPRIEYSYGSSRIRLHGSV